MSNVQLIPAKRSEIGVLRHLMQLYLYDFSEYLCDDEDEAIGEDGLYDPGFDLQRYWEKPGFWAYLARVEGRLAGFVLVSSRVRHRPKPGRYIDEFFVLRCYRRQGVGRALAFQTFDSFRGYWEITQIGANTSAQAFWRKVIAEYTQGRYEEFTTPAPSGPPDVWQVFDSGAW
jgi:predicted acetyltransferase